LNVDSVFSLDIGHLDVIGNAYDSIIKLLPNNQLPTIMISITDSHFSGISTSSGSSLIQISGSENIAELKLLNVELINSTLSINSIYSIDMFKHHPLSQSIQKLHLSMLKNFLLNA